MRFKGIKGENMTLFVPIKHWTNDCDFESSIYSPTHIYTK